MAPKNRLFAELGADIPASIVVFLVALPLCLGIALASGAPLFSGLITGIIGGIVVGVVSGSAASVSGPAAGLTIIVLSAIEDLGSFELFLAAVVLAGVLQLLLGFLRAGSIGYFFPDSVIKGMLAAIGLILILKQIPHAIGWDADYEGDYSFIQPDGHNTFSELFYAAMNFQTGAVIISMISLGILILWESSAFKKISWLKYLPAPLLVVILGVVLNEIVYASVAPSLQLAGDHLVVLPIATSPEEFLGQFTLPDFTQMLNENVLLVAFTIAIVASLETLLSVEATDKLDPYKRLTPTNRELKAQGIGNILAGMIGGLPMTAVIVRSSANVASGAKTKTSAFLHGIWLLLSVAFIPGILNLIPLSSLAAILLVVGYKLAQPSILREQARKGFDQLLPFVVTIVAILVTDLLIGIIIGMAVGLFFVIKTNFHSALTIVHHNKNYLIRFKKDASFLNKAYLRKSLNNIPDGSHVIVDGKRARFIDQDIREILNEFEETASLRNIIVVRENMDGHDNTIFNIKTKNGKLRETVA